MRLLVFGKSGQVSSSLQALANQTNLDLVSIGSSSVNISDLGAVKDAIQSAKPDIVVNPAAYTAVDKAEEQPDLANLVNCTGAGNVAEAASNLDIPVIHLSTDYVFDGEKDSPYTEQDPTNPVSVYGKSKLAGEKEVAKHNPQHIILRTAWVYSPVGRNFLKTMLNLAKGRDQVSVVADQFGNPTSADSIAGAILSIGNALWSGKTAYGTYHFCGPAHTSWAGFAEEIFRASSSIGGPFAEVLPITTSEYPTAAKRPKNSSLDMSKFSSAFSYEQPSLKSSIMKAVSSALQSSA